MKPSRVERPGARHVRRAAMVLGCGLFVTLIGGPCLSRWHWGYWWSRPGLSPLVSNSRSVQSITEITPAFQSGPIYDPKSFVASAKANSKYPYYFLVERPIASFLERGLLDTVPLSVPNDWTVFNELLRGDWLAKPWPGYRGDVEQCIIAEFTAQDGRTFCSGRSVKARCPMTTTPIPSSSSK